MISEFLAHGKWVLRQKHSGRRIGEKATHLVVVVKHRGSQGQDTPFKGLIRVTCLLLSPSIYELTNGLTHSSGQHPQDSITSLDPTLNIVALGIKPSIYRFWGTLPI